MLKVNNITKHFDNFSLENINFQLDKGYVLGISGANGAGKTTLMKLISKSLKEDKGSTTLNNQLEYRDNLAYHPSLFPFNSFHKVYNVLYFYDGVYKNFDLKKAAHKLREFDIDSKQNISKLSLGQKQKLILALILSINADLILLDEPTDGIDIFVRNEILRELQDHAYKNQATIIIATHQLEFYEDILDYVLYLENGKQLFYTDLITFKDIANNYLVEKIDDISLKSFAYQRQKENNYDQDN